MANPHVFVSFLLIIILWTLDIDFFFLKFAQNLEQWIL